MPTAMLFFSLFEHKALLAKLPPCEIPHGTCTDSRSHVLLLSTHYLLYTPCDFLSEQKHALTHPPFMHTRTLTASLRPDHEGHRRQAGRKEDPSRSRNPCRPNAQALCRYQEVRSHFRRQVEGYWQDSRRTMGSRRCRRHRL